MHNIFKSKKSEVIALMGTLLGVSTVSLILSCVAWFSEVDVFKPYDVYSSVITSYFDSGSGTESDPYVITRPIHYWNLVYLQESNLEGFADGQLYFQLGKDMDHDGYAEFYEYDDNGVLQWEDPNTETQERYSKTLNMNYYQGDKAIVPLGSASHPFTGHINGNNLTIKNLYINGNGRSDIGIFGYCDNHATVTNTYFYTVSIDIKTPNPLEVGAHTPSHTTTVNIGYICGHVYDADTSFNNVYINDCEIYNSKSASGAYDILNTYSYYGRVDVVNPIETATASYRSDLNPSLVHNFLDTNYSSISSANLKSRNTEYVNNVSSNKFGDAVGQTASGDEDYYSMNSNFSGTYDTSLSTVGYASGDTVVKNIRYYDGTDFNRLATTTTELDHEPTSADEDGKYVYWDSTNNRWKYAIVSSSSGEEQTIQFNCFYISFTVSSTKYYLYYDDSSSTPTMSVTSTAPGESSNEDDYYFVFKDLENSKGVAKLRSSDEQTGYYIYSPANQKYLTQTTYEGDLVFTDAFADALTFNIKGPETSISLKFSSTRDEAFIASSTGVEAKHTSGIVDPTIFDIGNVVEDQDSTTATYDLLTDASVLTDGSVIAIGTGYTGNIYVMSTVQNNNNRSTTTATVTNKYISNVPNLCEIELKQNTSGWAFYDKTYNNNEGGYLYAAGTKTSKNNYLRTESTLDSNNNGLWTITIDSSSSIATITNVGNSYTPYMLFNNGNDGDDYKLFACYNSTSKGNLPYIFLRNEASTISAYISQSVVRPYSSTISTDEKNISTYDTYVGALNSTTYTQLFTVKRTDAESIIFYFSNSTVSYTATTEDGWIKVTSISSLQAGDTIAIVAANYNYGMSTEQNTAKENRKTVDVTKIASNNTITFTDDKLAQLKLGGSADAWTFYDPVNSGYLYAGSSSNNYLKTRTNNNDKNGEWSIAITSTGIATIKAQGANTHNLIKFNYASTLFSCYESGLQDVCIYKYVHADVSDAYYIADEIGGYYNPDIMDVVGKADFYSDYVQIPGASTSTQGIASKVGSKFYATQYTDNALVIYVDNTGSRDLGTLTISYTLPSGSSAYPELIQSRGTSYASNRSSFIDNGCSDLDDGEGITYMLNINVNNIAKLCFCALDADGNIYATYDDDGSVLKCKDETYDATKVDRYVLNVGVNPGSGSDAINITSARFEFTQAPGNIGEFGTVGYRSAVYNDDGSLNESESRVTGTVLNFYYIVSTAGAKVTAKTYFDHTTHTYEIAFTSSVNCTIYIFNYDANTYTVKVNGQVCTHGTNAITITAS